MLHYTPGPWGLYGVTPFSFPKRSIFGSPFKAMVLTGVQSCVLLYPGSVHVQASSVP